MIRNALTIDVEDYFHVSAFAKSIDRNSWDSLESRVERNTEKFLEICEAKGVRATFFVLGWVADRFPTLVRRIVAEGHELACHGYSHQLIYTQSRKVFAEETLRAKSVLEDVSGVAVLGYRAASYSITKKSLWALEYLIDAGFRYDSSIIPARHDLYGIAGANAAPYRIATKDGRSINEFPPSTIKLAGQRIPIGGGGYFRLFPYWFTKWGLTRVNIADGEPVSFYLHPWELDPEQPRVETNWKSRFRHYNNLHLCESRLLQLLDDFSFGTMADVLSEQNLKSIAYESIGDARSAQLSDSSCP